MNDDEIVSLYWDRSERAVLETQQKYGKYCFAIAYNMLLNLEDAQEAVNDTYMAAWNRIPPHRPKMMSSFLGKITRCISINIWKKHQAEKRGGGEIAVAIEELSEVIPSAADVEHEVEQKQLTILLNTFRHRLPETEQKVFVCRYWYSDSVQSICHQFGFSQSKVKSMLARTRKKLRIYLERNDFVHEI